MVVVALVHVAVVLLGCAGLLAYRAVRRRRPALPVPRPPRRLNAVALEGFATAIGILAIIVAVVLRFA